MRDARRREPIRRGGEPLVARGKARREVLSYRSPTVSWRMKTIVKKVFINLTLTLWMLISPEILPTKLREN